VKKSNNERLTKILLLFLFLKELKFFTPDKVNEIKPAELYTIFPKIQGLRIYCTFFIKNMKAPVFMSPIR